MSDALHIQPFFHDDTNTWTYVVSRGADAVLIDPVLDYDPRSGQLGSQGIDAVLACLRRAGKPVSRMWVEDYTGYTKQSVNHILQGLCDAGEARRVEGGTVLLWEGV